MGKNRQSIGYKKGYWRFFHIAKKQKPDKFLKPVGFEILQTKKIKKQFPIVSISFYSRFLWRNPRRFPRFYHQNLAIRTSHRLR